MATEQEILTGLAEIVNEVTGIPADDVQLDKSFTDDLDIDSLSMVEVVVAAEEKFGVKIPDDEVKNLKTVGDAVSYIAEGRRLTPDAPGTTRHAATTRRSTMSDGRPDDVVVTGLGATTPVGGDVAVDLGGAARRPVRRRARSTQDWADELPVQIRRTGRRRPARRHGPGRGTQARPLRAARADRRARGVGRRRCARGRRASASASSSPPASAASSRCSASTTCCARRAPGASPRSPSRC